MRILLVSSFGYIRGGLERVMFDQLQWLRAAGHEVEYFATADERNEAARFAELFPKAHDYSSSGRASAAAVVDMFWNRGAAAAFSSVLSEFRPDVVHCQGVSRHLSLSIFPKAKRLHVPVVMTAHDCALVCPSVTLTRSGEEICLPRQCGRYLFCGAILHRCVQRSLPRSVLGAAGATYQRLFIRLASSIHTIICPSRALAGVLAEGGVVGPELVVLPNAVPEMPTVARSERCGPFVVSGRLTAGKGTVTALEAARLARVPIVVAGTGPLMERLAAEYPEAKFAGLLGQLDVWALIGSATAAVVPSELFENASISVLEAMALGVPVVASRIGGIPEQIRDGHEGLLVPPGDPEALAAAMRRLWNEPELALQMGAKAQQTARERFAPSTHVAGLTRIYQDAIASS
jgi:glycosyltransferase involved in cell wall biosynthesis